MCIIIDTNSLSKVFKKNDKGHDEFRPILEWIVDGDGKIVVGGTKFNEELFVKIKWFLKFYRLLKQTGKVVEIDNSKVEKRQKWIEDQKKHRDFDDPHLVALAGISGCRLVCTLDARSFPFLRDKGLYPKNKIIPAIYTKGKNRDLLCATYIAKCCEPKIKLSKLVKTSISAGLQ